MANIATVFVRVQPIDDAITAQDVFDALMSPERGTYHVPLWQREDDGFIDVQYGARWSGVSAVSFLWDAFGDRLGSVWVRFYDDGGDFDVIGHRTLAMPDDAPWRVCEYWYDAVRLTSRSGATEWRDLGERLRRAANERDGLGEIERDTPTTPASVWAHESCLDLWRSYGVPDGIVDELLAREPDLRRAELCWRGRPVEVAERVGRAQDRWVRWALDDWDTCADPDYLEFFA
jgi:hypothetical protein